MKRDKNKIMAKNLTRRFSPTEEMANVFEEILSPPRK
jgi:hypothetical protein